MTRSRSTVAVLGSGIVGAAVVAALVDTGRRVRAWGLAPSRYLSALAETGASVATSPGAALRGVDVVVVAPADAAEGAAVEAALGGGAPGGVDVLAVREPSDDEAWSSAWLTRAGVEHLDCVVFGRPTRLGTSSAVILVSGPTTLVETHRDLLDDLGVAVPLGGPATGARRTEVALMGLWYDVNVAILRALANVDPTARPMIENELRAILAQLPSVVRSVDGGEPVHEDAGIALHARALETINTCRSRGGSGGSELEQAAREVDSLLDGGDARAPLARIVRRLRWSDDADADRCVG